MYKKLEKALESDLIDYVSVQTRSWALGGPQRDPAAGTVTNIPSKPLQRKFSDR